MERKGEGGGRRMRGKIRREMIGVYRMMRIMGNKKVIKEVIIALL